VAERGEHDLRNLRLRKFSKSLVDQLAAIDDIPEVYGWLIANAAGDALATSLPAQFDRIRLDAIGRYLLRINDLNDNKFTEIEIGFGEGQMLAKLFGNGWLVALCRPRIDMVMARLTLNVTSATLGEDRSLQNDPSMALRKAVL
jgi:hypothetical protein